MLNNTSYLYAKYRPNLILHRVAKEDRRVASLMVCPSEKQSLWCGQMSTLDPQSLTTITIDIYIYNNRDVNMIFDKFLQIFHK